MIEIRSTSILVFFVAAIQFILIDNYNVLVVLPGEDFIEIDISLRLSLAIDSYS